MRESHTVPSLPAPRMEETMTLAQLKEQRERVESDMLAELDGIMAAVELFNKNAKLEIAIMKENLAQFEQDCQRIINDINAHTERIKRGIL